MTYTIIPVLEAIGITAAVQQRWPTFQVGKSNIIPIRYKILEVPVMKRNYDPSLILENVYLMNQVTRKNLSVLYDQISATSAFEIERIITDECWTGSQYIRLGYGPRSNTLAINLLEDEPLEA